VMLDRLALARGESRRDEGDGSQVSGSAFFHLAPELPLRSGMPLHIPLHEAAELRFEWTVRRPFIDDSASGGGREGPRPHSFLSAITTSPNLLGLRPAEVVLPKAYSAEIHKDSGRSAHRSKHQETPVRIRNGHAHLVPYRKSLRNLRSE
jgi:hypothetical protein